MVISFIDIILILILLVNVVRVSMRGFCDEFFSKAAAIGGLFVAIIFYQVLAPQLVMIVGAKAFSALIAFLVIFILTYILVKIIQAVVGAMIQNDTMSNLDRALGFFLGIVEGVLMITGILILLRIQPFVNTTSLLENSVFVKILSPVIIGSSALLQLQ